MGGGSSTPNYGGGGRIISATRRHDPTQLGRSPGAPLSTQGQWTNSDGLPTGSAWVVELIVLAEIRGEFQHGMKVLQSVTLNSWGQVVSSYSKGGYTSVGPLSLPGFYGTNYSVVNSYPVVTVTMNGTAISMALATVTGSLLAIDYSVRISLNLATQAAWLSGIHDGYPSYNVSVGGTTLYDFQERSLGGLAWPMEIHAEGGTIHW